MKNISNFFYNKSNLLIAILMTLLSFGYLFFFMIDFSKCFEIPNSDSQSLGTSFGFGIDVVQQFFAARSKEMILCYKDFNLIWDNIFAVLYGLMYVVWLSYLYKPFSQKVGLLNLFPFLQTIFDWLENFKVVGMANSFLTNTPLSDMDVQLASIFSICKWICSGIVFILLLNGIIKRILSRFEKRKS